MDRREARHQIEMTPKRVRRPVTRLSEISRGGMLLGFSYQEHLTCFVCSSIHVYDYVVARWTLEGALSRPILVPKLSPVQHNRWRPLLAPNYLSSPFPSSDAAPQPSPVPPS